MVTTAGPASTSTSDIGDGGDTGPIAQIHGADRLHPVKARTVADEVRIADSMPGSLGHAFDRNAHVVKVSKSISVK